MEKNSNMLDVNVISQLSPEEQLDLTKQMFDDISVFTKVCFSDIITSNLTPEQKKEYAEGTIDESIYMPEYQHDLYGLYKELLDSNSSLKSLALVLFREAAKSTIKRIIACYCICFGLEPYIMFLSETQGQSVKDLTSVKDMITNNDVIKLLFGDMKGPIWNEKSSSFIAPNGKETFIETAGYDTAIRGTNRVGQRPTLVFSDDFESKENSNTEDARKKVRTTIGSKIMRMGDSTDYKLVFMGTIVHNESYLSKARTMDRFNSKTGKFYERMASASPSIYVDPITGIRKANGYSSFEIGPLAWPAKYSKAFLEQEALYYGSDLDGGRSWWEFLQELYNIPKSSSDPTFNIDMIQPIAAKLKHYENFSWLERVIEGRTVKTAITVVDGYDPAAGRDEMHDRSIKLTLGLLPNGTYVIIDIVAERLDIDEQRDIILDSADKYVPKKTIIETYGYQLTLVNYVRKGAKPRGTKINIEKYSRKGVGGKTGKFKTILAEPVNSGKIVFLEGCANIKLLLQEMAQYLAGAKHDDTLDGLFLCIIGLLDMKTPDIDVDAKIRKLMKKKSLANFMGGQKKKIKKSWMTN